MFHERAGMIVWVSDVKQARNLEKYGTIHYISRKMRYVVLYLNAERYEDTARNVAKLGYVKQVERSMRNEIKTEYSSNSSDKTKFHTF